MSLGNPLDCYDIAVIGGGHAGCEAALAAARLGARTILFTMSLDAIGNLPCNPSIGGTAKGHLVRELDALGGEMGKAADDTLIQSRMLNRGKGPAVHSLRAQIDRGAYHLRMKQAVEDQPGLDVRQAEVIEIQTNAQKQVTGVVTALGTVYPVQCAILCSGTYLKGKIYVGDYTQESGPDGMHPARALSDCLKALGIPLRRFKTGTPARAHRASIDFTKLEEQPGEDPVTPFSFQTKRELKNKVNCHIAYTNEETHAIIRANIHRSPLYGGKIEGIGPRYCPSIEDKVVRFPERPRHQIFVEPMGLDTQEMYLQGMSSSLPEDVQMDFYRSIAGFEGIKVMRNAYAIEYDCVDPTVLYPTLEFKEIAGLFGAGQFNGTSGYEEAAAQGLVAGVNAAHRVLGKQPLILPRSSSYIGTLIDDLITKGCQDPYRMMTSRSEYRLVLRQDNADERLMPIGHEIGLISGEIYAAFLQKQREIKEELRRLSKTTIPPSEGLNKLLTEKGTAPIATGVRAEELLRRPQLDYEDLRPFDAQMPALSREVTEQVQIKLKYEGYIKKQLEQVEQAKRLEAMTLPTDFDYHAVAGLRLEAIEKLSRIKPASLGQASGISGVNPADITVLTIYLKTKGRE